jgi:beta-glucanase (GH16 family)
MKSALPAWYYTVFFAVLSIFGALALGPTHGGPPPASTTTTSTVPSTSTTTTSTTTTVPAGTSCGGQTTIVSNGTTWTCSFDTEFTGTTLDTLKWSPVATATSGYTSGLACFVNTPNNISVGNGYLSLTARQEAAPFLCQDPYGSFLTQYTSGEVTTLGSFSQTYGRFEVSAKVPAATVAGLQSSFWLYPQNEQQFGAWPASGEIDIAETYSQNPGLAIPYIHYNYNPFNVNATTNTNEVTNNACTINPDQFNDYVVEWTPSSITMIFNGHTCLVDHWIPLMPETAPQPFNQPFFINLTQALGIGTNNFNPLTTPLPATTEVQFVRVWQQHS